MMMIDSERRYVVRLDANEMSHDPQYAWLVDGQSYRGRNEPLSDDLGATRRHVRLFDPNDATHSIVLFADQLEPAPAP